MLPPPEQKEGVVDVPVRPPNPWQGVRAVAVGAVDEEDTESFDERWVDTSTGELIEGAVALTEVQERHLLRLCPDGSLPPDAASDDAPGGPQSEPTSGAATVAAPSSPRGGDTFLEELFS
jgi:hypothetical protein